jgi:hypothetical protein
MLAFLQRSGFWTVDGTCGRNLHGPLKLTHRSLQIDFDNSFSCLYFRRWDVASAETFSL